VLQILEIDQDTCTAIAAETMRPNLLSEEIGLHVIFALEKLHI
jgi:hypothetical protein